MKKPVQVRIRSARMPESVCVKCKVQLDSATGFGNARPKPGDITICLYCGHILEVGDNMELRSLSPQKFLELPDDLQGELTVMRTFVEESIATRAANRSETKH
jgi:hypothetical protein